MSACLRTLFVVIAVLSSMLMPFQSAKASTTGVPCNQTSYLVKTLVLIGLDDLSVPVYTPAATPDGLCLTADFNGDGLQDLLVQGNTASDNTTIYLGDGSSTYSTVHQSWGNGYLGLDWDAGSSTIYVGNFDADDDDKADIILETSGSTSAILYSDASGNFGDVALTWNNIPVSTGSETIVVGTTPGSFNVSNGGANYSVPIEVPPGVAGMAPKLALNYSSQAGNGIAGVGWSLSGLSTITRCPKTIAQDGVKGGISINNNDRFCLDGQRLVNVNGSYGAGGTEYRTEIESFSRVTSHGAAGSGPAYFTVETKSGLTMTYGNTANSFVEAQGKSTALIWAVNRIEDKNGNYIDVFYYENSEEGESYPLRIDYTGNDSQAPTRAVAFSYDTARPDGSVGYVAGSKVTKNWRLKNIKTYSDYSGNVLVRDYRLAYESSPDTERSRLIELTECAGSSAISCMPTVTFGWVDGGSDGWMTDSSNYLPPPIIANDGAEGGAGAQDNGVRLVDLNGDGLLDMIQHAWIGSSNIHKGAWINTGTGWASAPQYEPPPYIAASAGGNGLQDNGVRLVDLNGDGLLDLVQKVWWWSTNIQQGAWINSGSGWVSSPEYVPPAFIANAGAEGETGAQDNGVRFVDLNGDGLFDMIHHAWIDSGNHPEGAWINNGTGWQSAPAYTPPPYIMNAAAGAGLQDNGVRLVDLNGDGLLDMIQHAWWGGGNTHKGAWINTGSGWSSAPAFEPPPYLSNAGANGSIGAQDNGVRLVDLNGDGLLDMIQHAWLEGSNIHKGAWINTGAGWSYDGRYMPPPYIMNNAAGNGLQDNGVRLVDLNGDGLLDMIQNAWWGSGNNHTGAWINTGSGWSSRPSYTPSARITNNTGYGALDNGVRLVDLNGDGLQEFIQHSWLTQTNIQQSWRLNNRNIPDLMVSADSSMAVTEIDYRPLTDITWNYQKGSGSTNPEYDIQGPMYVVSSVRSDNGLGGQSQVDYSYKGAKQNVEGRGFLGFSEITVTDQTSGVSTIATFRQDFPHTGSIIESKQELNGKVLSLTQNQQSNPVMEVYPTTTPKVIFPYTSQSIETRYDYDTDTRLAEIQTDNVYDTYGNLTQVIVANKEFDDTGGTVVDTITTTTNNQFGSDAESKRLGRLSSASVTKIRSSDNATSTRNSSFAYDPVSGQLVTETIEPGTAFEVRTLYGHDQYGNRTLVKKHDPSNLEPDRDVTTTYTADGYFIATVTNAVGHTETHTYDPRFGKPTSLTGPNGLTTTWAYDAFGRQSLETRADGSTTTTAVRNCVAADNCDGTVITTNQTGAPESRSYHDRLGRKVRVETDGFASGDIYARDTRYDARGRVVGESSNYKIGNEAFERFWTCNVYDLLDRVIATSGPDAANCDNPAALPPLTSVAFNRFQTTITLHNDSGDQLKTEWRNAAGERIRVDDDLTTLTFEYDLYGNLETQTVTPQFTYDAQGNKVAVTNPVPVITAMNYDPRGRKTSMNDPDKGTWVYSYNAFGEMVSQTDANGQTITMKYDLLGRIKERTEVLMTNPDPLLPNGQWMALNDDTTLWEYDTAAMGKGKLARVHNPTTGYDKSLTYDLLGRPQDVTTTILGSPYTVSTSYYPQGHAHAGKLDTISYPTTPSPLGGTQRFAVQHSYDANGYPTEIRNAATSERYWQAVWVNANGQVTGFNLGTGMSTAHVYDPATGRLMGISTSTGTTTLQDLSYQYDRIGNLMQRKDLMQNLVEDFGYDGMNRLTSAAVELSAAPVVTKTYAYDALGNITSKPDFADEYLYGEGNAGPHAVTTIKNGGVTKATYSYNANGAMTSGDGRTMRYKTFGKVYSIERGSDYSTFAYNEAQMRIVQTSNEGTTVYLNLSKENGNKLYEKEIKGNITTHVNYVMAGGGVIAEYRVADDTSSVSSVVTDSTQFMHKDHLGSTDLITDASGNEKERMSFDPFGSRRVVTNWDDPITALVGQFSHHGFTGHEHLDELGIIHMNGRVYDPALGRFLSADPFIQEATSSQAYNRYTYVSNNPMTGTDPSGYLPDWLEPKNAAKLAAAPLVAPIAADLYMRKNYEWYRTGSTIAASAASAVYGPWVAAANSALNTYATGGSSGDVIKSAAVAYVSTYAGQKIRTSSYNINLPIGDRWTIRVNSYIAGAVKSGIHAAAYGEDVSDAALRGIGSVVGNQVLVLAQGGYTVVRYGGGTGPVEGAVSNLEDSLSVAMDAVELIDAATMYYYIVPDGFGTGGFGIAGSTAPIVGSLFGTLPYSIDSITYGLGIKPGLTGATVKGFADGGLTFFTVVGVDGFESTFSISSAGITSTFSRGEFIHPFMGRDRLDHYLNRAFDKNRTDVILLD